MAFTTLDLDPASARALLTPRAAVRVALVHDCLTEMHAGEHLLAGIAELFPSAEIFTLLCTPSALTRSLARRTIHTSWLQAVPAAARVYQHLVPLLPSLIESLDLSGFDLVISSSQCVACGVRKPAGAVHVSYLQAPARYLWSRFDDYFRPLSRTYPTRVAAQVVRRYLQRWDRAAARADRVDLLIANSEFVAAQIESCYERQALVVHPFVDLSPYDQPRRPQAYYLMVSDLAPDDRVDLAILAFNRLKLPLWVVDRGSREPRLQALAGPSVRWLGAVTRQERAQLYAGARALIVPGVEDFGVSSIEAMGAGVPVIAYAGGAATETVVDGVTGILFRPQSVQALVAAVQALEAGEIQLDSSRLRTHARQFSKARFQRQFLAAVRGAWLNAGRAAAELPSELPH